MPRDIPLLADPALILRPVPRAWATGREPVRFGGGPCLPEGMDWPRDAAGRRLHFLAQIDLGRLPRGLMVEAEARELPQMPRAGTLLVFLPLGAEGPGDGAARVLWAQAEGPGRPETPPPADLPELGAGISVDPAAILEDRRTLRARPAEPLPCLVAQGASAGPADASLAAVLARPDREMLAAPRTPPPGARPVPPNLAAFFPAPQMFGTWDYVHVWAAEFSRRVLAALIDELDCALADGGDPAFGRLVRERFDAALKRAAEIAAPAAPSRLRLVMGLPDPTAPYDLQAMRWARVAQRASGQMPERAIARFLAMLERLEGDCDRDSPADLTHLEGQRGLVLEAWNLRAIAREAAERAEAAVRARLGAAAMCDAAWDARVAQQTSLYPEGSTGQAVERPIQMFGAAGTSGPRDTMLLRIGEPFGSGLVLGTGGRNLRLWVDAAELARGDLGGVVTTFGPD